MVLAATLLLAVYFQRTISGPLLELATTAQMVTASGNYHFTANQSYSDETGILAQSFNTMLEEVRRRDQELVHANETLEEKVAARTQEMKEAMKRAEAASEAKSEFLRNMSHEFRTPLHAIMSFSSYGIKEYATAEGDELKRYFEIIRQASDRLCKMVNEVLDLARMENGAPTLEIQQNDLRQMVTFAVDMMQPLAKEKGLNLQVDHLAEGVTLACDQGKIVQVITNMLGNAVKFTPKGAGITLRTETKVIGGVEHISLAVADEGVGIPEGETEMIFESFRQSSRTNTGAGGTGLGLAICRGIIEGHGGKIWAENNEGGKGATFTFILPVQSHYKNTNDGLGVHHENAA
jgi:signal transduction histidine kinase